MEERTVRGSAGCGFANSGCIACIAGVEFDDVPAHVFGNGPGHRCFSNAGWPDEENGFFLRRAVLPLVQPRPNFPALNLVAFKQLLRTRAVPLGPITC